MAKEVAAQAAPWEAAAPHEQLFVLITGANSGIGLSTGERLIDEFLASRSLISHLILIPTTRSPAKSRDTIHALRAYAIKTGRDPKLTSRGDSNAAARIHVLSPQVDLCDIRDVHALAERLCGGTLGNPDGTEGQDALLKAVRVPRLDSAVFNAAYGGWSGFDLPLAIWKVLTEGIPQTFTWPTFKIAYPTRLLNDRPAYKYPAKPTLGEVFCACVFGHYILAHQLSPILSRPHGSSLDPSRIIWSSSLEAIRHVFSPDDIQALKSSQPYESTKRLTDLLVLTQNLPSVRPISRSFMTPDDDEDKAKPPTPAKMYLTHPGIVISSLFPVPWFLIWAYHLGLFLARWLGSPWHTVDAYSGARSAAWIALQQQEDLDRLQADRVKWGSATTRSGESRVKKTEVEGWGWEGRVEDSYIDEDGANGVLRKRIGRKKGSPDVTKEDIDEFEKLGAECWEQMEELREEWSEILDL